MEQLKLCEQDLVNAVCMFHAKYKLTIPEAIEVELTYDDEEGYGAEACYNGECIMYTTAQFITAIRYYLEEFVGIPAVSAGIQLEIEDEMVAYINY